VRVESLRMTGYRRLADHEVRFREGLNLIVGPNNSGKTSLLQALAVVVGTGEAGHPGGNWARDQTATGGAWLEAVLRPSEEEWRSACALLNGWKQTLEAGVECGPEHARVAFWPRGLRVRAMGGPNGPPQWSFEEVLLSPQDPQAPTHLAAEHRLADLARCLGNAFYRREFSREVLVSPVYLGGADRHVGATESQPVGTEEFGRRHAGPGGRLGEYVSLMTEEQRAGYGAALAQVISPEFVVATQSSPRTTRLRMTVRDDPAWMLDADWQGSGVQWAMVVLAALHGPSWGPILIDEVESALHPDLAVRLVGVVRDDALRLGKQVVATTHSGLITADADPEEMILIDDRDPLGLWVGRNPPANDGAAVEDALDALGVPAIGYSRRHRLGAKVVVAVEGRTDVRLLEAFARKAGCDAFARSAVALVSLGGADRVERASESAKLLAPVHAYPKALICVMDRDERSDEEISGLKRRAAPAILHVLQRCEIENYLLDADAIAHALAALPGHRSSDITPSRVRERLHELADGLRPGVRRRRTARALLRKDSTPGERMFGRELEHRQVCTEEEFSELLGCVDLRDDRVRAREAWNAVGEQLDRVWQTERLALAPGSKVLTGLMRWCQERYGRAPRPAAIVERMVAVPDDVRTLLDAIRAAADQG
jgi:energy-coupling factor transporter ATP-binding protein EcfA2